MERRERKEQEKEKGGKMEKDGRRAETEEEREMEKDGRRAETEEEREMEKGWRKEENRAGVKVLCQHHCTQHGRSVVVNVHMRMWHYSCKVGAILKLTS